MAEVASLGEMRVALLNLDGGSPVVLLGSAVCIWELMDGTRTEADLLVELNAAFPGVDQGSMEAHLRDFLVDLHHHGLAMLGAAPARTLRGTEKTSP